MLKIHVDEEYGYAEHIWYYPGTPHELLADWLAGHIPAQCACFLANQVSGKARGLVRRSWGRSISGRRWDDRIQEFYMHMHEEDDSRIIIGKLGGYTWEERENYPVLGE